MVLVIVLAMLLVVRVAEEANEMVPLQHVGLVPVLLQRAVLMRPRLGGGAYVVANY